MVYLKFIRSDGETFTVDNKQWGMVNNIDGISFPPVEINTTNLVGSAGSILNSKRVSSRDITFELVGKSNDKQRLRNSALSFFNCAFSFKILISYLGNTKRQIDCELYNIVMPAKSIGNFVTLTITMLALNPYFKSEKMFNVFMAKTIPTIGFPYVSVLGKGFNVSVIKPTTSVQVKNNGDVSTPFKVVTKFTSDVVNPTIRLNDSDFTLIKSFTSNDILVIDFTNPVPIITINGVNSIQYIKRDTNFNNILINRGISVFSFDAESGSDKMQTNIYYYEQYLGVC